MRDLIKADMIRALRKPSFWIVFVIMCVAEIVRLISNLQKGFGDDFAFFVEATALIEFGTFIFSMNTIIAVYADEFRSSAYISVIGHGLSRTKLVIAKFLDCMLLLIVQFIISAVVVNIVGAGMGLSIKGDFLLIYLCTMISVGSTALITAAFATVFAFLTMKIPTTMAAFVIFGFLGQILPEIVDIMPVRVFFNRCYYFALNHSALTDVMFGSYPRAVIVTVVTFSVYVGIPIGIATLVFRKKELEL